MLMPDKYRSVAVIGGGVAGIQASLDLASAGYLVHLVEKSPTLGGRIAKLDKASTPADSLVRKLYPKMMECARNSRIELHTCAEAISLTGSTGEFRIRINQKPRYVKEEKCIGCRACVDKCPVKVPNEYGVQPEVRKAIFMPFPESLPRIVSIDSEDCLYFTKNVCRICEKFCTSKAIDYEQKPREIVLNVEAIVLATGPNLIDASVIPDISADGIYRCSYPTGITEEDFTDAMRQGSASAARVAKMFPIVGEPPAQSMKGVAAKVDPSRCDACGACESLCASGAPKVTSVNGQKVSQISPLRCDGCGTCVAGCPRFAITLENSTDEQILEQVRAAFDDGDRASSEPKILMFTCKYCGYSASDPQGAKKLDYSANLRAVSLPCSGRVDPFFVIEALKSGADGVIISGCRPGYCHFLTGNKEAARRYESLKAALESQGVDSGRVRLEWISPSEPKRFANTVKEMVERLRTLDQGQMGAIEAR
jgi:heterodisulfide reductase subunit A-like polyferredoxin/coenzyme F420-reducing hydrogenase delta subunit